MGVVKILINFLPWCGGQYQTAAFQRVGLVTDSELGQ
jgi:hypothetical protein